MRGLPREARCIIASVYGSYRIARRLIKVSEAMYGKDDDQTQFLTAQANTLKTALRVMKWQTLSGKQYPDAHSFIDDIKRDVSFRRRFVNPKREAAIPVEQ